MEDFIPDCLEIVSATREDYKLLAHYHYRPAPLGPIDHIFKTIAKPPHTDAFPNPIAVIVYSMPLPQQGARDKLTNNYFKQARTSIGNLRLINSKIRYISRFIVDPRFQKLGIGTALLQETLRRQSVPIVETQTPIDFTNKIFQAAGFHLSYTSTPANYARFLQALEAIGLNEQATSCPPAVHARLNHLGSAERDIIEKQIHAFLTPFRHRKDMDHSLERTAHFCSKIPYPRAYLIWHNPAAPRYDEKPAENAGTLTMEGRGGGADGIQQTEPITKKPEHTPERTA